MFSWLIFVVAISCIRSNEIQFLWRITWQLSYTSRTLLRLWFIQSLQHFLSLSISLSLQSPEIARVCVFVCVCFYIVYCAFFASILVVIWQRRHSTICYLRNFALLNELYACSRRVDGQMLSPIYLIAYALKIIFRRRLRRKRHISYIYFEWRLCSSRRKFTVWFVATN